MSRWCGFARAFKLQAGQVQVGLPAHGSLSGTRQVQVEPEDSEPRAASAKGAQPQATAKVVCQCDSNRGDISAVVVIAHIVMPTGVAPNHECALLCVGTVC